MTELNAIYNARILELAARISGDTRLPAPDATATAHSKMCGSTVTIDLVMRDGVVAEFGQTVKACLLGQAAASVVGREIVGTAPGELRAVAARMRDMLKAQGSAPTGRWADLAVLEPVREHKSRHASTLLVFDAVERALGQIEAAPPVGPKDVDTDAKTTAAAP